MTPGGALFRILGVFLVGVAVGALGLHLFQGHSRATPRSTHGSSFESLLDLQLHLDELSRRLDLSSEQRDQVERVLSRASHRGAALHEEVVPRVVVYLEQTKEDIRRLLEPAQQQELDRLHAEHQRAFHHFLLGQGLGRHSPARDRGTMDDDSEH